MTATSRQILQRHESHSHQQEGDEPPFHGIIAPYGLPLHHLPVFHHLQRIDEVAVGIGGISDIHRLPSLPQGFHPYGIGMGGVLSQRDDLHHALPHRIGPGVMGREPYGIRVE